MIQQIMIQLLSLNVDLFISLPSSSVILCFIICRSYDTGFCLCFILGLILSFPYVFYPFFHTQQFERWLWAVRDHSQSLACEPADEPYLNYMPYVCMSGMLL